MSARRASIVVVLEARTSLRRVFGRGEIPPRSFEVLRYDELREGRRPLRAAEAILYEVRRGQRQAQRRLGFPGKGARCVPVVPFRVGRRRRGGAASRRCAPADGKILEAPLDPRTLAEVLARERRIVQLRRHASRALSRVRRQEAKLTALAGVVRATGREFDPRRIVEVAMAEVGPCLDLRAWILLLLRVDQGCLVVEQTGGPGVSGLRGRQVLMGEGLAGRAAQNKRTMLAVGTGVGAAGAPNGLTRRTSLAVPLTSRGRVIGVIEGICRAIAPPPGHEEARLMSFLLEPAAAALDSALLLRKSEELSITDDLTKLYNSRYLNTTLRREVERGRRYRMPVSLIFLDLDGFKEVNDQHGHLSGSRTLVEVGAVIKSTVRGIDVVSRFGGDEFTVILPQTDSEGALIIAERIRQRIAETVFLESYGLKVRITASLGIACFPEHGIGKDDLIARADQAMYVVKGRGKNSVALAGEAHDGALIRRVC